MRASSSRRTTRTSPGRSSSSTKSRALRRRDDAFPDGQVPVPSRATVDGAFEPMSLSPLPTGIHRTSLGVNFKLAWSRRTRRPRPGEWSGDCDSDRLQQRGQATGGRNYFGNGSIAPIRQKRWAATWPSGRDQPTSVTSRVGRTAAPMPRTAATRHAGDWPIPVDSTLAPVDRHGELHDDDRHDDGYRRPSPRDLHAAHRHRRRCRPVLAPTRAWSGLRWSTSRSA